MSFAALFIIVLLAFGYSKSQTSVIPPEAQVHLDALNYLDTQEEFDVAECPDFHPGRRASGETNAWISYHKEELDKLGVHVRWNCKIMAYEVVTKEKTLPALCRCQR